MDLHRQRIEQILMLQARTFLVKPSALPDTIRDATVNLLRDVSRWTEGSSHVGTVRLPGSSVSYGVSHYLHNRSVAHVLNAGSKLASPSMSFSAAVDQSSSKTSSSGQCRLI